MFNSFARAQALLMGTLFGISQSTGTSTATSDIPASFSTPTTSTPTLPEITSISSMHVSALIGKDNAAAFQCWKIHPDFIISPLPGTAGARIQPIGNIAGASVIYFDANKITYGGLHASPAPQWVLFLAGGGFVKLPQTGEVLPLKAGDIVIANDTSAVSPEGHDSTWFPGTIAMQLPFASGEVDHVVLHDGPCTNS